MPIVLPCLSHNHQKGFNSAAPAALNIMHKYAPNSDHTSAPSGASASPAARPTRVIAISSGKGGVGKTSVTTNLGIALAQLGAKVCILDADTGLANINILLNLRPEFTIEQLLNGEKTLDEIMLDGPHGIKVIPAASGISECAELDEPQHQIMSQALTSLESRFDYLLIDTAAGIGDTVLQFLASAQYCVLVISPEPTSLTDAFALMRVMKRKRLTQPIYTIVNRAPTPQKANEVFKRFSSAAKKYLHTRIGYMGCIAEDATISSAICLQTPIIIAQPESPASRCISTLATRIDSRLSASKKPHQFSKYWHAKSETTLHSNQSNNTVATPSQQTHPAVNHLAAAMLAYLQHPDTSETEAQQLLQPVIDASIERFGQSAFALPTVPVLTNPLPQPAGIASDISRLMSNIDEPEAAAIIQQILNRHERLYKKSPLDIESTLLENLCQSNISETKLSVLIETLQQHYREHFGDSLQDEKTKLLETFAAFSQQIRQREEQLDSDLQQLSQLVQTFHNTHHD